MGKIWFSSDTHFGHANIIKYCSRPFSSLEEMNSIIVRRFNERIKDEDTVFFLGDFCFRNGPSGKQGEGDRPKADFYQKQLKGKWIFIKGNHDKNNSLKTPIERMVIGYGGYRINLVHNPTHADSCYVLNLVGHVHEKWKSKRLTDKSIMYNVGVDVHNFYPVSFEEIERNINEEKKQRQR